MHFRLHRCFVKLWLYFRLRRCFVKLWLWLHFRLRRCLVKLRLRMHFRLHRCSVKLRLWLHRYVLDLGSAYSAEHLSRIDNIAASCTSVGTIGYHCMRKSRTANRTKSCIDGVVRMAVSAYHNSVKEFHSGIHLLNLLLCRLKIGKHLYICPLRILRFRTICTSYCCIYLINSHLCCLYVSVDIIYFPICIASHI